MFENKKTCGTFSRSTKFTRFFATPSRLKHSGLPQMLTIFPKNKRNTSTFSSYIYIFKQYPGRGQTHDKCCFEKNVGSETCRENCPPPVLRRNHHLCSVSYIKSMILFLSAISLSIKLIFNEVVIRKKTWLRDGVRSFADRQIHFAALMPSVQTLRSSPESPWSCCRSRRPMQAAILLMALIGSHVVDGIWYE